MYERTFDREWELERAWRNADDIRYQTYDSLIFEKYRRDLSQTERDDLEKMLAERIGECKEDEPLEQLFDYQGFPVLVGCPYGRGLPVAVVRGCNDGEVYMGDDEDDGYLERIDKHLDWMVDRPQFNAFLVWAYEIERSWKWSASPDALAERRVYTFRRRLSEWYPETKAFLDAADKEGLSGLAETHEGFVEALRRLGYACLAFHGEWGGLSAVALSVVDDELIEFVWSEPDGDLKMAAAHLGKLPMPKRMMSDSLIEFFDSGRHTVSLNGELFALKAWGRESSKMPVSYMLAEFCCFDRMVCDAVYGCRNTPRWRGRRSVVPRMERESVDGYHHVKFMHEIESRDDMHFSDEHEEAWEEWCETW